MIVSLANKRNRFFIPSKENVFGKIKIEYVMVDTGCNTVLLPMPLDINCLKDIFYIERYSWEIRYSSGVGALQSPVLIIEDRIGDIEISLSNDIFPYKSFIRMLRFHVSYDDAMVLVKMEESNPNMIAKAYQLVSFVSLVDNIRKISQDVIIGKRRKHALLGQSLIKEKSMYMLQYDKIAIICNRDTYASIKDVDVRNIEVSSINHVSKVFHNMGKEFEDLEDEDHDEDHVITLHVYEAVDE